MLIFKRLKYISVTFILLIIISCSTKKNTFVSRNWHALNTRDNILYNGKNAFVLGLGEVKAGYQDNFWSLLPIERMQIEEDAALPGQKTKNTNFEKAEDKAIKAIQKHSMNIEGKEKNYQIDEAYLMLGKARYYDKRYIPALEAFNYILYKYPNSNKIYEAKVWREKTNIRLENDAVAVKNLKFLIKKNTLSPQIQADAEAMLAQAFINLEQKDSAVAPLKKAIETTKIKEERARYRFILGQIYEMQGHKDSANMMFQDVIGMKRKSPRQYVIRSHAKQAQLANYSMDTLAFAEKYAKLLKNRENRPYTDVLYYQMGAYYQQNKMPKVAIKNYNLSLKTKSTDNYLHAQNYKNLAQIYFDKSEYVTSGKYYDSTLARFAKKDKEYFLIEKKRRNLDDIIKYEDIAKNNDSIIKLMSMSAQDKENYFTEYITSLKAKEKAAQEAKSKLEMEKKIKDAQAGIPDISFEKGGGKKNNQINIPTSSLAPPTSDPAMQTGKNNFYFYNPNTVAFGKVEFNKNWGKRQLKDNWRWLSDNNVIVEDNSDSKNDNQISINEDSEKYKLEYYLKQIPESQLVQDSLIKDRNMANYQLGLIYKEKFGENKLAISKLELVNNANPEERLKLPTWYHLFKLFQAENSPKSEEFKNLIVTNYPNSNFAQLVQGQQVENTQSLVTASDSYKNIYKLLDTQDYAVALDQLNKSLTQYVGDDLQPKFELLKATVLGKLKGLEEYKNALTYVSQTYPESKEGKQAEEILGNNIPYMERMTISSDSLSKNWKAVYKVGKKDDAETFKLIENITTYLKENMYYKNTVSFDVYNLEQNLVVIHGLSTKESALMLIHGLKENKKTSVNLSNFVISSDNYKVIQIKKNLEEYLALKL